MKKILKDKRIIFLYFITIIFLVIGVTYAISTNSQTFSVTSAVLKIDESIYGSTTFDNSNLEFRPILDSVVESSNDEVISIDFKVRGASSNNTALQAIYDIALVDLEVDCDLLSPYIKWKLINEVTNEEWTGDFGTNIINSDGRMVLTDIQQELKGATESPDEYQFYMWFSDSCQSSDISQCTSAENQENLIGKNLSGKIEVELYNGNVVSQQDTTSDISLSKCIDKYIVNFNYNGGKGETTRIPVMKNEAYGSLPDAVKEYTVTFNSNGGTDVSPKNVVVADSFQGWYKEDSFATEITSTTVVSENKNHTLYAKWRGYGTLSVLPTPSKENYSFEGWYTSLTGGTKVTTSTQISKDITLYAHYTSDSYNINYEYNGGTAGTKAPTIAMIDGDVNIDNPTKIVVITGDENGTGAEVGAMVSKEQTFIGWTSNASDGLGSNAKTGTSVNPSTIWTGDLTKDTYFKNLRDTSGEITLTANWTAVAVTLPIVTKTGYTCGWNTKADGSGDVYASGASYTPSATSDASVTMYAVCTINAPATPTITGGSTKIYGVSATTLTCATTSTYASGISLYYSFGYATSTTGTPGNWTTASTTKTLSIGSTSYVGIRYYYCRVYAKDSTNTSYVVTSATYTTMTLNNAKLTFNATTNGGVLSGTGTLYTRTGVASVYTGITNSTVGTIPTASKTGYTFDGWYTASSGGSKVLNADGSFTGTAVSGYTSAGAWTVIANKTLYAQYTSNTYEITLDGNGATTQGTLSTEVGYGATSLGDITLPQILFTVQYLPSAGEDIPADSVVARSTFEGWYTTATGGSMVADSTGLFQANVSGYTNANKEWIKASATTLYAHWTYETITLPAPTNIPTGATFAGWYSDKNFTFKVGDAGDSYQVTSTVNLYPKWKYVHTATVFYYENYSDGMTVTCETETSSENCSFEIPSTVKDKPGPNNSTYIGVGNSPYSASIVTTPTSASNQFFAVYEGEWTINYSMATSISAIGKTKDTCATFYTLSSYEQSTITASCSITLPAITLKNGYVDAKWLDIDNNFTEIGEANEEILINKDYNLMASARPYSATELTYDNSKTLQNCDTVQCMIDRLDEILEGRTG